MAGPNNISNVGPLCCGCGSCAASCPKLCISFKPDSLGFLYPQVFESQCSHCGICIKSCPVARKEKVGISPEICKAYWASNDDAAVLKESSSGGIFNAIANLILKKGGVIYGAALDETCAKVTHMPIEDGSNLHMIQQSKYLQSYIGSEIYHSIDTNLQANRPVLFSGTACQIMGIKNYRGGSLRENPNLICIDVICHGVPSSIFWQMWLEEISNNNNSKVVDVNFRSKTKGWASFSMQYVFENGEIKESIASEDWWYRSAFLGNATLRSSCFHCFSKRICGSDITLGDYWGIGQEHPEVDSRLGVSAVIVNTEKGMHIWHEISDVLQYGDTSVCSIGRHNPSLYVSSKPYSHYEEFVEDVQNHTPISVFYNKYSFDRSLIDKIQLRVLREFNYMRLRRKVIKNQW